jgi:EAL domain-containing protein (putative c-di-GMP-specific phosphodiesterase class I)
MVGMPGEFIPVVEDTGMIPPLGQWVMETVCHQLAVWANSPQTAPGADRQRVPAPRTCRHGGR